MPADGAQRPAAPLRGDISRAGAILWGATSIAGFLAVWAFVTAGDGEMRLVSPAMLPSPVETAQALPRVFGERKLATNTLVTLAGLSGFWAERTDWCTAGRIGGLFPGSPCVPCSVEYFWPQYSGGRAHSPDLLPLRDWRISKGDVSLYCQRFFCD